MSNTLTLKRLALLVGCIALAFLAAGIGSLFTAAEIPTWYAALQKPSFNPPNWVFGPVWTVLYLLQGIALYLVISAKEKNTRLAVAVFMVQLVFNTLWSIVFFGAHQVEWALIVIGMLLVLIFATIRVFHEVSPLAGRLLWPYAAWVSFATVLNIGIIVVNK